MKLPLLALLLIASGCSGDAPQTTPKSTPAPQAPTASSTASQPSLTASPAVTPPANPAPDFTLALLDGGTFRLSDYRGRLPVMAHFWAPW